jgi:hypothetical protein
LKPKSGTEISNDTIKPLLAWDAFPPFLRLQANKNTDNDNDEVQRDCEPLLVLDMIYKASKQHTMSGKVAVVYLGLPNAALGR